MSGIGAKEIVASTIGILYPTKTLPTTATRIIRPDALADGSRRHITPLAAYCFLLFILALLPCMATLAASKKAETKVHEMDDLLGCIHYILAWAVPRLSSIGGKFDCLKKKS